MSESELPDETAREAERLTRLARKAVDDNEAGAYRERRERLLATHGFVARVREDDDVLVCYPTEWVEDGTVRFDRIEDTDRAVERSLSGAGDADQWAELDAHNRDLVAAVADGHGEVHAANARAFVDFLSNHYARRVEAATAEIIEEFLTDYYRRNVWPSEEEAAVVEKSLLRLFETADVEPPSVTGDARRDR
ncbi:MAG: rnhA operon protein [Halolamina sp.]